MFNKNNIYKYVNLGDDWMLIISLVVVTIFAGLVPSISSILIGRCFKIFTNIYYGKYQTFSEMENDLILKSMSLIILAAGYFPLCWALITLWMRFGEIQNYRIRSTIFSNYMSKNLNFFDTHEHLTAEFIQTNRCIEELRQSCSEATGMAMQSIVSIIGLFSVSCYYSWSLTLIFLCSTPLIAIIAGFSFKKYRKYTDLENDESMKCSKQILNVMENINLIKLNLTELEELTRFDISIKKCNTYFIKGSFWISLNQSVLRMLSLCMFVQGFWFGATEVKKGNLSTEKVITCFSSCLSLGSNLMSCIHQIIIIQKGNVALKFVDKQFYDTGTKEELLNKNTPVVPSKDLNKYEDCFNIRFTNVTAHYQSRPNITVIKNVTLDLNEKQFHFIVGTSGSGKSSLFNLLLKLYDNNYTGMISLNNYDVRSISSSCLLSKITLVEQHTHLFNDTLKNNILLGCDLKVRDDVYLLNKVIKIAQLTDLIKSLPKGLDTVMGESVYKDDDCDVFKDDNVTLSSGQQQKVAIARALIRNTPVIIFDESLSAIDIKSRILIMEGLKKTRQGMTTILLTHDISCIESHDRVYLMKAGSVVEFGTQEQLISTDSHFKRLYQLKTLNLENQVQNAIYPKQATSDIFEKQSLDLNSFDSNLQSTETSKDLTNTTVRRISNFFIESQKNSYVDEKYEPDQFQEIFYEEYNTSKRLPLTSLTKIFKSMYLTINKKFYLIWGLSSAVISGVSNPVFSWADAKLLNSNVLQKGTSGLKNEKSFFVANTTQMLVETVARYYPLSIFSEIKNSDNSTSQNTTYNGSSTPSNSYVIKWCLIVISIAAIDGIATFLKEFLLNYVAEYWIMNLRHISFETILNNHVYWFSFALNKPSEISALLINDLKDMRTLVSQFLTVSITVIFVSLCGLIWSIISGWKLSLVGLSLIPLYIITTIVYTKLLQNVENGYKTSIANLENKQYDVLKNFKTIKILQLESIFQLQVADCYNKMKNIGLKRTYHTGIGVALFSSLTFVVQGIIIFYGLKLVIIGEYSSSQLFTTFSLLLFTIVTCAMLSSSIPDLARGQRGATYVFQIINNSMPEGSVLESYSPDPNKTSCNEILKFENVNFVYPNTTKLIFDDLSFSIKRNQTVALVGPSGSGKSTITKLLAKFQTVTNGCIKLNNVNITQWNLKELRKYVVVFEQKCLIFRGTLKENLVYGNKAKDFEILNLIHHFQLDSLLNDLNGLYGDMVDSTLISGGQLQRLNIIRQLLRLKDLNNKCKIVVFDEITASLDPHTSSLIEDYIINKLSDKGKIIITHNTSLMMKCEKLIVFDQCGQIKESDTFNILMNKQNSYLKTLLGVL